MRIHAIAMLLSAGCAAALAGCASARLSRRRRCARSARRRSARPSISRIRDVGAVRLPQTGAWKGEPDGVAGPGELLLIEGDNFGRLPTVSIGGRATTIVARTDGRRHRRARADRRSRRRRAHRRLAAQGPLAEDVPDAPLRRGRARRQALLPARRQGRRRARRQAAAGAGRARGAHLGRRRRRLRRRQSRPTAIIWSRSISCAPGGPRLAGEKKLAHHGALLAAAMDAPIAAVVGDGEITMVSHARPARSRRCSSRWICRWAPRRRAPSSCRPTASCSRCWWPRQSAGRARRLGAAERRKW